MSILQLRTPTLLCVIFSCTAGCTPYLHIGSTASKEELKGVTKEAEIFPFGPLQPHTKISASALVPGGKYMYTGQLEIDGDVPNDTVFIISDGKFIVNGNTGKDVTVIVSQPVSVSQHTEKTNVCYGYDFTSRKYEYSYKARGCDDIITSRFDGLVYNDPQGAINISGSAGKGARMFTYGSIFINGKKVYNPEELKPVEKDAEMVGAKHKALSPFP